MCQNDNDGTVGTTASGGASVTHKPSEDTRPWQCYSCQLMNSSLSSLCQGCLLTKFHSTYDLRRGYSHLSDNDLAAIIQNSDSTQLQAITQSLEFQAAIYRNHCILSLLIDIGRINLIFLLFRSGFKFALNHRPRDNHNDDNNINDGDGDGENDHDGDFVDDDQILPLSMAFERDEIYLIKLLLEKGANPNGVTQIQHLSLHYEWFDLSQYTVYVHLLPISIPIRKMKHLQSDNNLDNDIGAEITEYEEIFNLLIHHGALWFEDEFMSRFSGHDASFWIEFLSSSHFRTERLFVHNAMKKHYEKSIKPQIVNSALAPIESLMAQYFVTFPMLHVATDDDKHCDDEIFGEMRVTDTSSSEDVNVEDASFHLI